jgi:SAM-dependent methyltransferase
VLRRQSAALTAYDAFMGRYAVRLAPLFADFAGARSGLRVLDVGAGTGALTDELARRRVEVTAVEPDGGRVAELRRRSLDAHEAFAEALPFADDSFDLAVAQLVVAFMDDARLGLREMARVAPTVAVCSWGREIDLFEAIDRAEGASWSERTYPDADALERLVRAAGLVPVEVAPLDVTAPYGGFDDFVDALEGFRGPQPPAVRDRLFRELGSPTGPFELDARAFAARARRA